MSQCNIGVEPMHRGNGGHCGPRKSRPYSRGGRPEEANHAGARQRDRIRRARRGSEEANLAYTERCWAACD